MGRSRPDLCLWWPNWSYVAYTMVDYGSGPRLDRYFDFTIDQTGDVDASSGIDELRKDLAFRIAGALEYGYGVDRPVVVSDGVVGDVLVDGTLADIEIALSSLVVEDSRVDAVRNVEARTSDGTGDTIEIDLQVVVDDSTVRFDRIFPVN